jgi:predicted membrane metal-binding protein
VTTLDDLGAVALGTMAILAITELHVELLAGGAAWLAAWWFLREPVRH